MKTKRNQRCQQCGNLCKQFHARYDNRGLCKSCNEKWTFLPDGRKVMWKEYHAYHKQQREANK